MRDVFKQSLVDSIDPTFAAREKLLVERITNLFPNFNLNFLLDEFSFSGRKLLLIQLEVIELEFRKPKKEILEKPFDGRPYQHRKRKVRNQLLSLCRANSRRCELSAASIEVGRFWKERMLAASNLSEAPHLT